VQAEFGRGRAERGVVDSRSTSLRSPTKIPLHGGRVELASVVVESVGDPNHFSAGVKTDGRLGGQQ
jgi:hypothetical protein